jgi:hypothetical protein
MTDYLTRFPIVAHAPEGDLELNIYLKRFGLREAHAELDRAEELVERLREALGERDRVLDVFQHDLMREATRLRHDSDRALAAALQTERDDQATETALARAAEEREWINTLEGVCVDVDYALGGEPRRIDPERDRVWDERFKAVESIVAEWNQFSDLNAKKDLADKLKAVCTEPGAELERENRLLMQQITDRLDSLGGALASEGRNIWKTRDQLRTMTLEMIGVKEEQDIREGIAGLPARRRFYAALDRVAVLVSRHAMPLAA